MTIGTVRGLVQVARAQLLVEKPFFASLALRLELIETRQVATMATDAVHLYYNPDWTGKLPMRDVMAVICHEVLHCAAAHCMRIGGRDPERWNMACDYAINPMIVAEGLRLPDKPLIDDKFKGMVAEQIYNILPPRPRSAGGAGKPSKQSGKGAPGQADESSQGKATADEEPLFGPDHNPELDVLPTPADKQAAEVEAEWKQAVMNAVKAAKAQGMLPAGLEREVSELVRPKVDWRSMLRRFVQETARNDYTWRRPATRYQCLGLYLPILRSEQMPPIVVAIDTSGSIGGAELQSFRSEVDAIIAECNPERVTVLYADAAVAKVQELEQGEPFTLAPAGGGGTDFRPAFRWVEKEGIEPTCFIYLTDMYGSFPDVAPPYPVMWLATSEIVAPFGETVRMDMLS